MRHFSPLIAFGICGMIAGHSPAAIVVWDGSCGGTSWSQVCGPKNGTIFEGVVQNVDIATGRVLFEWHSADHVALTESYVPPPKPLGKPPRPRRKRPPKNPPRAKAAPRLPKRSDSRLFGAFSTSR